MRSALEGCSNSGCGLLGRLLGRLLDARGACPELVDPGRELLDSRPVDLGELARAGLVVPSREPPSCGGRDGGDEAAVQPDLGLAHVHAGVGVVVRHGVFKSPFWGEVCYEPQVRTRPATGSDS